MPRPIKPHTVIVNDHAKLVLDDGVEDDLGLLLITAIEGDKKITLKLTFAQVKKLTDRAKLYFRETVA